MVETNILGDAVFHSCTDSFFFIVTVIMLRLTVSCPWCRKQALPARHPLTCTVKLWLLPDVASHFVCVFFFSLYIDTLSVYDAAGITENVAKQ